MSTEATPGTAPGNTSPTPAPGATPPAPAPTPVIPGATPPTPEVTAISYEATGDAALDMSLSFIGKLGIGPDSPEIQAAEAGNFALLKAKLAGMGSKAQGWEQYIALGEQAWKSASEKIKTETEARDKIVHDAVGGAEQWAKVEAWAKENAEPAERAAVNKALAAGGIASKAMAMYLGFLYDRKAGVQTSAAEVFGADRGRSNGGASPGNALSPRAYVAEVQKARSKMGGRFEGSQEYADLRARRAAWRG